MNESKIDLLLKERLKGYDREMPDRVSQKIDETLRHLPQRGTVWQRVGYFTAAAALVMLCLMGAKLMFPSFAKALDKIPFIGQVFELVGNSGMEKASQSGFVTGLNQMSSDNGVDLTITGVMYDGSTISIGYVEGQGSKQFSPNNIKLYADGRQIIFKARGLMSEVGKNQYGAVMNIEPEEILPDSFILRVDINSLMYTDGDGKSGEITGRWSYEFPVTRIKGTTVVQKFNPPVEKSYNGMDISVRKVSFTPYVTEIEVEANTLLVDSNMFEALDDTGKPLKLLNVLSDAPREGLRYEKSRWLLQYENLNKIPDYIVLRPTCTFEMASIAGGNNFPLTVFGNDGSVGGLNESVTITGMEFSPDRTLIYYKMSGHGYWWPFWIKDVSGIEYEGKLSNTHNKNGEDSVMTAAFPAISQDNIKEIITKKANYSADDVKQLEIKILLK